VIYPVIFQTIEPLDILSLKNLLYLDNRTLEIFYFELAMPSFNIIFV
jgi:hypothetical protein